MTKRKNEDELVETSTKKNKMQHADGSSTFTAADFIRQLETQNTVVEGLQNFCSNSKQFKENGNAFDLVKSYISVSPDCNEIFKIIQPRKVAPNIVSLTFEALTRILMRTVADLSDTFSGVGTSVCRRILQGHLQELYGALNLKNSAKLIMTALRMVTAMVMQGNECALDVAMNFDLGGKVVTNLLRLPVDGMNIKQRDISNIRWLSVRFVLSFLVVASLKTLQHVLEVVGFLDTIFLGLPSDTASCIQLILSTVLEKVIRRAFVPKTHKVKLLARKDVLSSIASLLEWNGTIDVPCEEGEDGRMKIKKITYEFLRESCCSLTHGINFRDPELGTGTRSSNHVLLKLLRHLEEHRHEDYYRELIIEIFRSCPDLLHAYFSGSRMSLEPRITELWFKDCRFVLAIYDRQPQVAPAICDATKVRTSSQTKFESSKLTKMVIPGLIPPSISKSIFKAILEHPDEHVLAEGLQVIVMSLRKLKDSLDYVNADSNWSRCIYSSGEREELGTRLQETFKKNFPALPDFLSAWESHEGNTQYVRVKSLLLESLSLYQQTFPESISRSAYNFSGLLHGMAEFSAVHSSDDESVISDHDRALRSLISILLPLASKFNWFKKKQGKSSSFYSLLKIIVTANRRINSSGLELINEALELGDEISIIYNLGGDLHVWIYHLIHCAASPPEASDHQTYQAVLMKFFADAVTDLASHHFRFSNKLSSLLQSCSSSVGCDSSNNNNNDLETSYPLLLLAASQQISKSNYITDANNIAALDRYLSNVLVDLLHRRTFTSDVDMYVTLTSSLLSEISILPLSKIAMERALLWKTVTRSLGRGDKDEDHFHGIKSISSIFNAERCSLSLAAKLKRDVTSLVDVNLVSGKLKLEADFSATHDLRSTIRHTHLHLVVIETEVARILYYLNNFVNMWRTLGDGKNREAVGVACVQLCGILRDYILNVEAVDEDERKDAEMIVEENEIAPLTTEKDVSDEKSSKSRLSRENLIVVIEKVLGASVMKNLFAVATPPCCVDLVQRSTEVLTHFVCLAYKLGLKDDQCCKFYKDKVATAMQQIVASPLLEESTDYDVLMSCFNKLLLHLGTPRLMQILTTVLHRKAASSNKNLHSRTKIIERCLQQILKDESGKHCITRSIARKLFKLLMKGVDPNTCLLNAILQLLHHLPSSSLHANEDIVEWCLRNSESDHVVSILQVIVQQNLRLRHHLMDLCATTQLSLPASAGGKLSLLPVFVFLLVSSPFVPDDHVRDKFIKKFKKCFWKILWSSLTKDDECLGDPEVIAISWLIEHNQLKDKQIDDIVDRLPALLIDRTKYNARWRIATVVMDWFHRQKKKKEEGARFRSRLLESILELCCDVMKSDDDERSILITEIAQNLRLLLNQLQDASATDEDFSRKWNVFIKHALKYELCNSHIVALLSDFVSVFHNTKPHNFLGAAHLYQMITGHSSFLDVIFQSKVKDESLKEKFVGLLHKVILRCSKEDLDSKDFLFLLGAYGGTLSVCDQRIFQIILLYESLGLSMEEFQPFMWGAVAVETYPLYKDKSDTVYQKPTLSKVLDCIDDDIMLDTLKDFPIKRRMNTSESFAVSDTDSFIPFMDGMKLLDADEDHARRYDPLFLLGLITNLLSPENLVDCRILLQRGIVSFLFSCLSSHCPHIRDIAASCILAYVEHAESARFPEKDLILYLIRVVRNAFSSDETGHVMKIPSLMSVFLSTCASLLMQPHDHMYVMICRFLLVKPELDVHNVPMFYDAFYSDATEYKAERAWMMELLSAGIRDMSDFHMIERRKVCRALMCFYESPMSDNHTRRLALKIFKKVCLIRGALFDLINRQALLPWLRNILWLQSNHSLTHDIGIDSTKRQNPTSSIADVVTVMWSALRPLHMNCQQNVSGSSHHQSDAIGFTEGDVERRSGLSVWNCNHMVSLCVDLLSNFLLDFDKLSSVTRDWQLDDEVALSCSRVLKILSQVIAYINERKSCKEANNVPSAEHGIEKFVLMDHQCDVIMKFAVMLKSSKIVPSVHVIDVIMSWIPRSSKKYDSLKVMPVLTLCVDMATNCHPDKLGEVVNWVLVWGKASWGTLSGFRADSSFCRSITKCYEVAAASEDRKASSECTRVLDELTSLLLDQNDPDTMPRKTTDVRCLLYLRQETTTA